jgi:AraC-like DNA-binding protein
MPDKHLIQSEAYLPHAVLQPYISTYLFTSFNAPVTHIDGDATPMGYSVISFALQNTHIRNGNDMITSRFNITGQITHHYPLCMYHSFSIVYIIFKPFGAYRLLGLPQHLLTDACNDITNVMDSSINDVYNKITDNAHDHIRVLQILEQWLLRLWQKNTPLYKTDNIEYACSIMQQTNGTMLLRKLGKETGMSESTMERRFKEKIGIGPKMFNRIIRFNKALQTIQSGNYEKWNDVVYNHQYFDQAHFIKEFKTFYGYTPSEMHARSINMQDFIGYE